MEIASDDDLEVAAVLAKGLGHELPSGSMVKSASFGVTGRHSNYSPRRSSTVLTNNSRGNTATVTPSKIQFDSIHQLAAKGELVTLTSLLDEQQVEERDRNGLTPLMWAAMYGQSDVVSFLLQAGAEVNACDPRDSTSLMMASYHGSVAVIKCLLEANTSINQADEDGNTALMYAVFGGQNDSLQVLLEKGADLTRENHQGVTIMEAAVKLQRKQVQKTIDKYLLQCLENT